MKGNRQSGKGFRSPAVILPALPLPGTQLPIFKMGGRMGKTISNNPFSSDVLGLQVSVTPKSQPLAQTSPPISSRPQTHHVQTTVNLFPTPAPVPEPHCYLLCSRPLLHPLSRTEAIASCLLSLLPHLSSQIRTSHITLRARSQRKLLSCQGNIQAPYHGLQGRHPLASTCICSLYLLPCPLRSPLPLTPSILSG